MEVSDSHSVFLLLLRSVRVPGLMPGPCLAQHPAPGRHAAQPGRPPPPPPPGVPAPPQLIRVSCCCSWLPCFSSRCHLPHHTSLPWCPRGSSWLLADTPTMSHGEDSLWRCWPGLCQVEGELPSRPGCLPVAQAALCQGAGNDQAPRVRAVSSRGAPCWRTGRSLARVACVGRGGMRKSPAGNPRELFRGRCTPGSEKNPSLSEEDDVLFHPLRFFFSSLLVPFLSVFSFYV